MCIRLSLFSGRLPDLQTPSWDRRRGDFPTCLFYRRFLPFLPFLSTRWDTLLHIYQRPRFLVHLALLPHPYPRPKYRTCPHLTLHPHLPPQVLFLFPCPVWLSSSHTYLLPCLRVGDLGSRVVARGFGAVDRQGGRREGGLRRFPCGGAGRVWWISLGTTRLTRMAPFGHSHYLIVYLPPSLSRLAFLP